MVYLLAFRAPTAQVVDAAIERARLATNGWALLARGQDSTTNEWTAALLVATHVETSALRGFLTQPALQILVQRVSRDWAAMGMGNIVQWLQAADRLF